jgi:hypothetical protein
VGREQQNVHFVLNLEVKKLLGGPSYRWKNIKLDLKEIKLASVDWVRVGQDRDQWRALVNTANNIGIP